MDDRNQNLQCHPSSAVAVVEAEEADVVEEVSVVGCEEAAIGAVSAVDVVEASEVEVEGVGELRTLRGPSSWPGRPGDYGGGHLARAC